MHIIKTVDVNSGLTWGGIKKLVEQGTVRAVVHTGDKFPITLKNGDEHTLIAAYDGNGKLYFVFEDCIVSQRQMNTGTARRSGWVKTDMQTYLNNEIFPLLPDEIQTVIAPTRILQVIKGKEFASEDKLFLLSQTQVCGIGEWSCNEPEDSPLDIFAGYRSRVKENHSYSIQWWLRTPLVSQNYAYYFIGDNGSSHFNTGFAPYGVAPAFCL